MRKPKTEGDIRLPEWLVEMMQGLTSPEAEDSCKWMSRRRVTPSTASLLYHGDDALDEEHGVASQADASHER